MSVALKVVPAGLAIALGVFAVGAALERSRFGTSDAAAVARVEIEVQQRFDQSAESLSAAASRVAAQIATIRAAPRDTAAAQRLFAELDAALPADRRDSAGITVYNPAGTPLAWAGHVSEYPRQAASGAVAFVTAGAPGPRLVFVQPLINRSRPAVVLEATIVVELAVGQPQHAAPSPDTAALTTSIVPVTVAAKLPAGFVPDAYRFPIATRSGAPLAEGGVSPTDLANARSTWQRSTRATVLAVIALTLLFCTGPIIDLRRKTRSTQWYLTATAGLLGLILVAEWLLSSAATTFWPEPPRAAALLLTGLSAGAVVWLAIDMIERRRYVRPRPRVLTTSVAATALLVAAYVAAGIAATWIVWRYERTLEDLISRTAVDLLHFSQSSLTPERLALAFAIALIHASVLWAAAGVSRVPGLLWRTPKVLDVVAGTAWAVGVGVSAAILVRRPDAPVTLGPLLLALGATGLAAVALRTLRSRARRVSQATRLLALFLALLVPTLAMYPSLAAFSTDAREDLISMLYAPEVRRLREDLQVRVQHAIEQIDTRLETTDFTVRSNEETGTDLAFRIWSGTDLAAYRLTSSVEIYGFDRRLISRFALKLPPESPAARYGADSCTWTEFDETSPFGSNEHVLHYSRDVCQQGRVLGAIVARAMLDYRTLSFIGSQSPYLETFGPERPPLDVHAEGNTDFVVYGWSRAPLFISGTRAWTLPDPVFDRMVESRGPLWTTIDRDGDPYRVYLFNDRAGIYALGYPAVTWFGHLINLTELSTLTVAPLYVLLIAFATLFSALALHAPASGRKLLREIRSSFYRKLFLYYVAGAVVPVVILAFATRTYFATELRAGIDEAAARTATVAERLVEDYAALQQRGAGAFDAIDDQIMVLVGQAIDHDVSLFDRTRLQATSERDLFESQVLSARTPASVYRAIELDRLPTYVGEDLVGDVRYRIAAAPVRAGGREGVVTVPMALQQEEIEQQIHELDHRVLFGAVLFSLLGAALGYWLAERIADPVNRLTRATRRIARGDLDARIAATSSDELRRLVEDFNQMAADLKKQRADLERTQRLEAWADMARQVAHDIKNPLTPIQLSAEHARRVNLDRGRPLSPALDECVNSILTQVRLLRQIAAEFSSFASSPTARPEPTSVPALLEEVIRPYRTGLDGRVEIETYADEDIPAVSIDKNLFSRAITNIIENALHAMPGGGTLTISTRHGENGGQSAGSGQAVVVEVTDTGVGMDEPALARIFEPYFSTKATGTGLGLTIAKRNVEINGGVIDVRSERGVGTTVTITLRA